MGAKTELVGVLVRLKDRIDSDAVKKDLEALAEGLSFDVYLFKSKRMKDQEMTLLLGAMNKSTYESLFKAKLNQITVVEEYSGVRGSKEFQKWIEVKEAEIPAGFENRIKAIQVTDYKNKPKEKYLKGRKTKWT